jgi:pilus assembly protein CpaC
MTKMRPIFHYLAIGFLAAFLPGPSAAQPLPPAGSYIDVHTGQSEAQLAVPVNKSQLLHLDGPYREISVGDKDIADVVPLSRNLIYVLGKKYGTTNLTIRGNGGAVLAVVDVMVTYDVGALQKRIHELVPEEAVTVTPTGDSIALTGDVTSEDHLHQIMSIAGNFVPSKIINMMSVDGSQQVLLEMRFAEVRRDAVKSLGINTNLAYSAGGSKLSALTGSVVQAGSAFGTISGIFNSGNYALSAQLNALEQKSLARTLAEPNLVTLSGQAASFLAGGEFPIPVVQSINGAAPTVTIQYQDFGVGLAFTPTITGKDFVNLVMNLEVSSLDSTASITANGFSVPGLKVRRARTTIELHDGQSFAIAGMLQNDFNNAVNQFPWLGNLPVLGTLLRSSSYQNTQTDLVVIVTAHLVQPTIAARLATPVDDLVLPTPAQEFGQGKVEGDESKTPAGANQRGYVLP